MKTLSFEAVQAAGDTTGAESIQSQIDALNETEVDTEEMDELKENMETYGSLGSEAGGASKAGQSVADFLKTGTPLGVLALADGAWLAIAAIATTLNILACAKGAAKDGAKFNWAGVAAGLTGAALFGVAAAVVAAAGTKMLDKGKNEIECGSAGSGMQGHVNTLNDMIGEHSEYMDATTEAYDETDEESRESQQEAAEAAAEVTANGGTSGTSGNTSDDEDEDTVTV